MKLKILLSALLVATVGAAVFSGLATAQQPTPSDDEVNRTAKGLYCPVCENIPLDVCPTQACAQWRDLIRQKLSQGWTDKQVKDYFVQQYGDRVLAEPPRQGLNWLVYILPPVFLLAGAVILYRTLRTTRKTVPDAGIISQSRSESDDAYLAKMEEELHTRGEG